MQCKYVIFNQQCLIILYYSQSQVKFSAPYFQVFAVEFRVVLFDFDSINLLQYRYACKALLAKQVESSLYTILHTCACVIKTIQFHYILYKLQFILIILIEDDSIYSASLYLMLQIILLFCLCYQTFARIRILKQAVKDSIKIFKNVLRCGKNVNSHSFELFCFAANILYENVISIRKTQLQLQKKLNFQKKDTQRSKMQQSN